MDPDYVADLFGVPRAIRSDPPGTFYTEDGKKGRASLLTSDMVKIIASRHMPEDKAYVVGADPANPDGEIVVMVDEASEILADVARKGRKTGIAYTDWAARQFPSLEGFIEQYTKFVPHNNNPKEKEYEMDMAGLARMRSDLEGMLEKFTSMVSIVERFGGEPGDGSVIKFEHEFDAVGRAGETVYTYAAIRKGSRWYVSGRPLDSRGGVKWSELLEFIGEGRAWIAETWREAPVPGAAAETVSADMVATFTSVLANSGGKDTTEVAEQLAAIAEKASKKD